MNRSELLFRVLSAASLVALAVVIGIWLSKTPATANPPAAAPVPIKAQQMKLSAPEITPLRKGTAASPTVTVTLEAVVAPPPKSVMLPQPAAVTPAAEPMPATDEDAPCY
jgi:hypothetical protein